MKKKYVKRFFIISIFCFLLLWAGEELFRRVIGGFSGSYPFVEYWDINARESEIIEAIKEIKKEDPTLNPPTEKVQKYLRDSGYIEESLDMQGYREEQKKDSTIKPPIRNRGNSYGDSETNYKDYWLYIDFYYADTKEVVHTWTRPKFDSTVTTLALYSLSDESRNNERLINKDFWYLANKKQIQKFKQRIVDRIQVTINKKRNSS